MIYNIAIVGETNVGKSTLFNKLIGNNIAIINDSLNFTRDYKLGILNFNNFSINIFDTAGIYLFSNKLSILQKRVLEQTFIAINKADLILFVINVQNGIIENNKTLINIIRKKSKKIFLILNKIDTIKNYQYLCSEYYSLGIKDIFLISALKLFGIKELKFKIQNWYIKYKLIKSNVSKINQVIKSKDNVIQNIIISIIGRPNVGKSTLFNLLLNKNRSIVYNIRGTTRDNITDSIILKKKKYIITDTAGIKKKNNNSVESLPVLKTLHTISSSSICILLIDYYIGFTKQDIWILNIIINSGKKILIIINKTEKLSFIEKQNIKKYLYLKYKYINFIHIHFISALYKKGINKIFILINKLYNNVNYIMKSSNLTKIMYQAIKAYPPKIIHGQQVKFQYAHPGGYNPPTIIIHGNRLIHISKNYKRYLLNFFQKNLNFPGNAIKIFFKNKKNPYII